MNHRIVDTQSTALIQALVVMILDGIGITHTDGQVAGCVLIKQGVVEQQATFGDGVMDP